MWILNNRQLTQMTDATRVKFRTNISQSLLDELEKLAEEHNTRINYLIETGLEKLLEDDYIAFDKNMRPKDRVQYKTTYDSELLNRTKKFAADQIMDYSLTILLSTAASL